MGLDPGSAPITNPSSSNDVASDGTAARDFANAAIRTNSITEPCPRGRSCKAASWSSSAAAVRSAITATISSRVSPGTLLAGTPAPSSAIVFSATAESCIAAGAVVENSASSDVTIDSLRDFRRAFSAAANEVDGRRRGPPPCSFAARFFAFAVFAAASGVASVIGAGAATLALLFSAGPLTFAGAAVTVTVAATATAARASEFAADFGIGTRSDLAADSTPEEYGAGTVVNAVVGTSVGAGAGAVANTVVGSGAGVGSGACASADVLPEPATADGEPAPSIGEVEGDSPVAAPSSGAGKDIGDAATETLPGRFRRFLRGVTFGDSFAFVVGAAAALRGSTFGDSFAVVVDAAGASASFEAAGTAAAAATPFPTNCSCFVSRAFKFFAAAAEAAAAATRFFRGETVFFGEAVLPFLVGEAPFFGDTLLLPL